MKNRLLIKNRRITAKTGDVLFVKGCSSILDYLIKFLTKSDFIHTAVLIEIKGLWFVIETRLNSSHSYQIVPIDWWLARHPNDEIYFGKIPRDNYTDSQEHRLTRILMDTSQSLRPYKLSWVILAYFSRVIFNNFRPNLDRFFKGEKPLICSTLIQDALEQAGIIRPMKYMNPGELAALYGGEDKLLNLTENNALLTYPTLQQNHFNSIGVRYQENA